MDTNRLESLANNADDVKPGANPRRAARLREYEQEIARLRGICNEARTARDNLADPDPMAFGPFIRDHLTTACNKVIATCAEELTRLEGVMTHLKRSL